VLNTKVLITGGLGFIGTSLAIELKGRGYEVLCLDLDKEPSHLTKVRISALEEIGVKIALGDVRNPVLVRSMMSEFEGGQVFHLAALAGVRPSFSFANDYFETNVQGALNVVREADAANVKRVFLASSSSVYGEAGLNASEDYRIDLPLSPYAASKSSMEMAVRSLQPTLSASTCVLRFFTVFGPMGRPDMAVWRFTKAIMEGRPVLVYGDGTDKRDFTPVASLVQKMALLSAMEGQLPQAINLGNSAPVSVRELVSTLGQHLGIEPEIEFGDRQNGDVTATCSSLELQESLGLLAVSEDFDTGIRSWVNWAIAHDSLIRGSD